MTLKIRQESTHVAHNWWDWSVWLDGTKGDLDAVDHVVYTLHPTFHPPVRRVASRRSGFKLKSSGWGEFEIRLDIALKNGRVRTRRHWLKLSAPATGQAAASQKKPVVYLSAGAADSALARRLREILSREGFQVQTLEDASPSVPEDKALDKLLESADVAVFLLSGRPSLWTYSEVERTLAHKVPHLIPVLVGTKAEVPPRLGSYEPLHLGSADELDRLAKDILATVGRKVGPST